MVTNSDPFITDLILFFYERDFIASRSEYKQPYVIQAFNSTSKYLDDFSNNDMVNQIYSVELQLTKLMCHLLKSHTWIYIYLFQKDFYLSKISD